MKGIRIVAVIATALALAACARPLPLVTPDQPHGVVVSQAELITGHSRPVMIVSINGVPVSTANQPGPLLVAPGLHTFRLSPQGMHHGEARDVRRGQRRDDIDAYVDIQVQPGRRYVVGAKIDPDHIADWRAALMRVEPIV